MLADGLGPPQIAALLVLAQRGLEELHSARNTKALLEKGGREEGRDYYPVVAVTHLAWLTSVFFLISPAAPVSILLLAMYLALQIARYWIIGTLGPYWTHRIITRDSAPIEKRGPYRFLRHPNYAVTIAETFLLPAMFGANILGLIMTAVWSAVVYYKIVLEDAALAARRTAGAGTNSATAK
jgi:methyltransferase